MAACHLAGTWTTPTMRAVLKAWHLAINREQHDVHECILRFVLFCWPFSVWILQTVTILACHYVFLIWFCASMCLYCTVWLLRLLSIYLSIYLFIRLSVCYFIFIFYHNMCHIIIHSFYILMYHICNNYYCAQFFYSNNETAWEMVIIALQKQQT